MSKISSNSSSEILHLRQLKTKERIEKHLSTDACAGGIAFKIVESMYSSGKKNFCSFQNDITDVEEWTRGNLVSKLSNTTRNSLSLNFALNFFSGTMSSIGGSFWLS